MEGRGGPLPPSPSLTRSPPAPAGSLPTPGGGVRTFWPRLLSHFSWEPRAAASSTHAPRPGFRCFGALTPGLGEEGETQTHRGEEEEGRQEGGRNTSTPMFIAALFIIARTWKQPRCPSADELIRKLWYIYTMEYYSAIKKNTFESILMRWMKLEPIIQSEVSQKEKHQYSILTHIYGI